MRSSDESYPSGGSKIAITLALATVLLAGATAIGIISFHQKALRDEFAILKRELALTREQIARLEKRHTAQSRSNTAFESRPLGPTPLQLSPDVINFIRSIVVVPPSERGALPRMTLGSRVPSSKLLPLPDSIVERVPKFRGMRFATDSNGAIVIAGEDGRVAHVILPRQ